MSREEPAPSKAEILREAAEGILGMTGVPLAYAQGIAAYLREQADLGAVDLGAVVQETRTTAIEALRVVGELHRAPVPILTNKDLQVVYVRTAKVVRGALGG